MLEFTGKKYLALVKPKVFPMVLVLDGSSEIGAFLIVGHTIHGTFYIRW